MTPADLKFCPRCAGSLEVRPGRTPRVSASNMYRVRFRPVAEPEALRRSCHRPWRRAGDRSAARPANVDDGRIAWDLPGGFLNDDDRLHDALRRECQREMGVEVAVDDLLGAFEDDFYGSRIVSWCTSARIVGGQPRAADIINGVEWFAMTALPEPASPAVGEALEALRRRVLGALNAIDAERTALTRDGRGQSFQIAYCCARRSLKSVSGSLKPCARTFFRTLDLSLLRGVQHFAEQVVVELLRDLHDLFRDLSALVASARGQRRAGRSGPAARSHPSARLDPVEDARDALRLLEQQRRDEARLDRFL